MVACMALLGREFIAVPDDRKGQIVFKWPDLTIRRFTRAIVNADEMALFVNTGQVVQTLGPGRHQIDANELPGLPARGPIGLQHHGDAVQFTNLFIKELD